MRKKALLLSGLLALGLLAQVVNARGIEVNAYLFWGEDCPHCREEKDFLKQLQKKYPQLTIKTYEVWHNKDNAKLFSSMLKAYEVINTNVPTTFVGDVVWHGYDDYIREEIEDMIRYCAENGCEDPLGRLKGKEASIHNAVTRENDNLVNLPVFGQVDGAKISLPGLTVILGLLDSFNPCAFFVLFVLLGLLIQAKSRPRMLLIGGTFVFFSGLIYFLFMSAWLNLFLVLGRVSFITLAAGAIALAMAVINIKDFFFFQQGVSLTIPDKAKPKLFERMRNLLRANSLVPTMIGTVILAVTANTYELLCTAGFPMVFTRVLTLRDLSTSQYYLYLGLYNLVYIIPLLFIVVMLVMTLDAKKLTSRQGQILKLISGMMMLCLGLILLIRPALLNNLLATIGLIAVSLLIAAVMIVITKKIKGGRRNNRGGDIERMA